MADQWVRREDRSDSTIRHASPTKEDHLMTCDSLVSSSPERSSEQSTYRGKPEVPGGELSAVLRQWCCRTVPLVPGEVQRLRTAMAAQQGRRNATKALHILDAALDSPLDIDASVLKRIHAALGTGLERHDDAKRRLFRVQQAHCEQRPAAGPVGTPGIARKAEVPSPNDFAALASQMRGMNRVLRQHAECAQVGAPAAEIQRAAKRPGNVRSIASGPTEKTPRQLTPSTIRGLHVCQGGHHFVLPIDKIERALDVTVSDLPTVQGKAVAHFSGEICDVVHLVDRFGLTPREDSSANKLIVISESGTRVCLAIDRVMGPVEASVTPIDTILPNVTGITGVVSRASGGLALVPDLHGLFPQAPS